MWKYTPKVMDHFLNPRNVGEIKDADAVAEVGNVSCGDALKIFLKLDQDGRICDVKFKTFGCASAIASSSALTELVKGMTLDEAAKVTNKEIVAQLGELPEEKMHCSVMGMEALQAAIADYKRRHGEKVEEAEADDEHPAEDSGSQSDKAKAFASLSVVQKVIRVQEVIDKEIRPALEKDGGSIELVDIEGNMVKVRLKGRCAACPNSTLTLKKLVQSKLNEFVSEDLTVSEVQ